MFVRKRYVGPERRQCLILLTHRSEYHIDHGVCVTVRSRDDSKAGQGANAVKMRLVGYCVPGGLELLPGPSRVGVCALFSDGHRSVRTGEIVELARPAPRENKVESISARG